MIDEIKNPLEIKFSDKVNEDITFVAIPKNLFKDEEHYELFLRSFSFCKEGYFIDFEIYDELFEFIKDKKTKITVAVSRLADYEVWKSEAAQNYINFIKLNSHDIVIEIIKKYYVTTLRSLISLADVITKDNIGEFIEYANKNRKVDFISYLLDYKATYFADMQGKKYDL